MQRFLGLIIGVLFLAVGIFMYIKNANLVKNCTIEVQGTVVDITEDFSADSDSSMYMYYPIIEYSVDNDNIRVKMDNGSNPPAYRIGEKITILYNPNKINEFIVKGEKGLSLFSIVFFALGVFITGYGIKMVLKKD